MIDAMTLLDVEELTRYWVDHPPLHLMVAAYLGLGKRNDSRVRGASFAATPRAAAEKPQVGALLAELGPSFAGRDVQAGLAPAVLDFTELKRRVTPTE